MNRPDVETVLYGRSAYDLWLKEHLCPLSTRGVWLSPLPRLRPAGDVLACRSRCWIWWRQIQIFRSWPPFTAIRQAVGLNKGHAAAFAFVNETVAELLAAVCGRQLSGTGARQAELWLIKQTVKQELVEAAARA